MHIIVLHALQCWQYEAMGLVQLLHHASPTSVFGADGD